MLRNLIIILISCCHILMVYGYNSYGCRVPMNFVDDQIASILTASPEPGWLDKTKSSPTSVIDPSTMCLLPDWEINLPTSPLVLSHPDCNNNTFLTNDTNGKYDDGCNVTTNSTSVVGKRSTMQISDSSLIHLASYCDQFLFHATSVTMLKMDHLLPKHILSLLTPIRVPSSTEEFKYYDAHVIVASQFVLQLLEIELCVLLKKHSPGKAPLLKDMIEALGKVDFQESVKDAGQRTTTTTTTTTLRVSSHYCHTLANVLRALLLPTGLNLRNLIWHGFLTSLHRRWLALSIVMLMSIRGLVEEQDQLQQTTYLAEDVEQVQHKCYFEFEPFSRYGANILLAPRERNNLQKLSEYLIRSSFLPESYLNLVQTSMIEYNPLYYPACFCTIITPLIEHGIRLLWCKCNDYNHMAFAQMSKYYVTLDGIGQRDRHHLLLLPILDHGENDSNVTAITNKLIVTLGAPILSLLADLFLSPCGGPNVRSAVAHGNKMWADALQSELKKKANLSNSRDSSILERSNGSCNKMVTECCSTQDNIPRCVAFTLITVLRLLADKTSAMHEESSSAYDLLPTPPIHMNSYRPCFTYASSFMGDVEQCIHNFQDLRTLMLSQAAQDILDNNRSTENREAHNALKSYITEALGGLGTVEETLSVVKNEILSTFDLLHLVTPRERGKLSSWNQQGVLDWTEDALLQEFKLSSIIACCGAARTLVAEVAVATEQLVKTMNDGLLLLEEEESSQYPRRAKSRRSVSFSRQCSITPHALLLYFFSTFVALRYIENEVNMNVSKFEHSKIPNVGESERSELLTIVKRSRMAVSTFSTYSSSHTERSIKAIHSFLSAKCMKKALKGSLLKWNIVNQKSISC